MTINPKAKLILIGVASLILGACSTPEQVRQSKPVFGYTTTKDSKKVAGCITDVESAWLAKFDYGFAAKTNNLVTRPTGSGWVIQLEQSVGLGRDVPYLVEITDVAGGGSQITGYGGSGNMASQVGERAKACL